MDHMEGIVAGMDQGELDEFKRALVASIETKQAEDAAAKRQKLDDRVHRDNWGCLTFRSSR